MKLDSLSFRELDRKWFAIDKKKDIKKVNKLLKQKFSLNPILAYLYIDHENGMIIRIAGQVIKENNSYYLEDDFSTENFHFPYDEKINFDITFLPEDVTSNIKGVTQIEIDCQKFYENEAIVKSREEEILDPFRHEYYPDDVELLLQTKEDEEYLWGRIDAYSPQHKVAVCTLLSDSIYNEEFQEGVQVFNKISFEDGETVLKIDKITR